MAGDWTKDEIEIVKAGIAQGHSARRIATDLGNGRSRNAVIGIIHRAHLTPTAGASLRRVRTPAPRKPHGNAQASGKVGRIQAAREKAKAPVISPPIEPADPVLRSTAWLPIPKTTPVSLLDLERGMCKWPIGDAPTLFCGQHVERAKTKSGETGAEKSYCPYHERFAYGAGTPSQRNAVDDAVRAVRNEFRASGVAMAGSR